MGQTEIRGTPFSYFVCDPVLPPDVADALLAWLEASNGWVLHQSDFFEQHEWNVTGQVPPGGESVLGPAGLAELRGVVERALDCRLADRTKVVAHQLTTSQGIGLHNDAPAPGDETHRLVLHLGHDYDDRQGGHLVFFDGPDPAQIHRVFRPVHNTAVGFVMSDRSFHAVSTVRSGTRFSLVFSFWAETSEDPVEAEAHDQLTVGPDAARSQDEARSLAFATYPGRYPVADRTIGEGFSFHLHDSLTPGASLDPDLYGELAAFAGVRRPGLSHYRVLRERGDGRSSLRTLDHCWALWAWSRWLARRESEPDDPVLLVHLDAHDDLGSPALAMTGTQGVFDLPLGAERLDVRRPDRVAAVLDQGRIGIGSFIVPFFHALGGGVIDHVWSREDRPDAGTPLRLGHQPMPGGLPGRRPTLLPADSDGGGSVTYRRCGLAQIGELSPRGPVLLDVDMDFFCNRFGGGGPGNRGVADSLPGVCAVIDDLGQLLADRPALVERVAVVTVALSPGFFPSAYWRVAVPRLEAVLSEALASAPLLGPRAAQPAAP